MIASLIFNILHIREHQGVKNEYTELDIPARLNIEADTLGTAHSTTSININILSDPFAIYVNEKYVPYKFEREITLESILKRS